MVRPKQYSNIFPFLALCFILVILSAPVNVNAQTEDDNFTVFLPSVMNICANKIPPQPVFNLSKEAETLAQINAQRAQNGGLPPLSSRDSLVEIARFHSIDMANSGVLTHDGSAGETAGERFDWLCEKFSGWGEIIGWGFDGDVSRMLDWWMNSKGHHDLILTNFDYAGVGYVHKPGSGWSHFWTVDFAFKPSTAMDNLSLSARPISCRTITETSDEGGMSVTICK